jgi:hypothetical protein
MLSATQFIYSLHSSLFYYILHVLNTVLFILQCILYVLITVLFILQCMLHVLIPVLYAYLNYDSHHYY